MRSRYVLNGRHGHNFNVPPLCIYTLTWTHSKTKNLKCPAPLYVEQESGSITDWLLLIGHLEPHNWSHQKETEGLQEVVYVTVCECVCRGGYIV